MWQSCGKDDEMVVAVVGRGDSTTLSRKWPQGRQQGKPVIPKAPMACCHREAYRRGSPPEPSGEGVAGEETIPVEGEHGVREGDDQAPDNGEENGNKLVMSRASAVVHGDAAGQSCRHGDLSQFHWSKKKNAVATRKSHSDSRGSCVRPPGDDCMFHKSRKAAVVGSLYRRGRMVDIAAK